MSIEHVDALAPRTLPAASRAMRQTRQKCWTDRVSGSLKCLAIPESDGSEQFDWLLFLLGLDVLDDGGHDVINGIGYALGGKIEVVRKNGKGHRFAAVGGGVA